jgi:2'-5' RNA ligase
LTRPSRSDQPPLVVTLLLDDASQERFERERAELFPPGRTAVGAHVTLFRALPVHLVEDVLHRVTGLADSPPFPVLVEEVIDLGRGVAYRMRSRELDALHRTLAEEWREHLTPQDRQPLRAHVTVQNKATRDVVLATLSSLRGSFSPFTATAIGVAVWRYEGGPWSLVRRLPFRDLRGPG